MPNYPCDWCQDEPGKFMISDQETGTTQSVGLNCLPLLGSSLIAPLPAEMLDAVLKGIGYQPSKALRDQRKADEVPEVDLNRTIGEVVESAPRIDSGESLEGLGDSETDQLVDNRPPDYAELADQTIAMGEHLRDRDVEHLPDHAGDDAPPY